MKRLLFVLLALILSVSTVYGSESATFQLTFSSPNSAFEELNIFFAPLDDVRGNGTYRNELYNKRDGTYLLLIKSAEGSQIVHSFDLGNSNLFNKVLTGYTLRAQYKNTAETGGTEMVLVLVNPDGNKVEFFIENNLAFTVGNETDEVEIQIRKNQ